MGLSVKDVYTMGTMQNRDKREMISAYAYVWSRILQETSFLFPLLPVPIPVPILVP